MVYEDELSHHGILGMKWGIRRYQNSDGTLTAEGKIRYGRLSKSKEEYTKVAEKHRKRAEKALSISMATAVATIPAAIYTAGASMAALALTPAVIGGLAVSTLLSGTAAISKTVAIGEAFVSDINYNRANKAK